MLLKILNFFAGLFGYEWVKTERPYREVEDDIEIDEDWHDITESTPHYQLVKKK
jgi:hypothetical protein